MADTINYRRMLAELESDGLFPNEIAAILHVTEQTLVNWKRGTKPQAEPLARLTGFYRSRLGKTTGAGAV